MDCYIKTVTDRLPIAGPEAATAAGREPGPVSATRRRSLRRLALVAAAALHLSPALLLLLTWPTSPPQQPPPAIPVSLVMQQPPPPPPPPPPQAKPTPPTNAARSSGADLTTAAPPQGEADTAHDEAQPAPPATAAAGVSPPPGTGQQQTAMLDPGMAAPAPAETPSAPAKEPPAKKRAEKTKSVARGDRATNGDPYLNSLAAKMERHYHYPELARPLGLRGIVAYAVRIDRAGRLVSLAMIRSAGATMLDEAGEQIIRETAPFPPPPADIPGETVTIFIDLPIVPR
ncbi:MAG: energy transducer TonB [Rhodospirillales bacterium]|nr:energy transducer TonB [Rhodospirillales bacterium]